MDKIKIIMDVDTGIDDAFAMCFAMGNPAFEILGFTTTYGNRRLEVTTENTLKILEMCGRTDIPVAMGADKPMIKPAFFPEYSVVHGKDGLGDMEKPLPAPTVKPLDIPAVEFMARKLRESDGDITLVPVGPLTNVAALLLAHPELKGKIKQICLMGGSTMKGNATPVAEANFMADPESAWVVFNSGVKIKMAGLDATWKGYISFDEIEKYKAEGGRVAKTLWDMTGIYCEHYKLRMKKDGIAMHDSLPLAWLLDESLVESKEYYVTVDIDGRNTYGMTVTDVHYVMQERPNAQVALNVDRERFIKMILQSIDNIA